MTDRRIVQCTAAFHVSTERGPVVVNPGDLYFADDPILKGRELLFSDAKVKSSFTESAKRTQLSSSSTEEATATPGKRRSLSRRDEKSEPEATPSVKDEKGGEV